MRNASVSYWKRGAKHGAAARGIVTEVIREETLDRLDFKRIRSMLADKCATLGGKRLAESLAPCHSVEEARRRFAETEEARIFIEALPIGMCSTADEVLLGLKDAVFVSPRELLRLAQALEGFEIIKRRLSSNSQERAGLLRELGDMITTFEGIRNRITSSVDEDGVKESSSPRLAELRRAMAMERRTLLRNLEAVIAQNPGIFQESAIHFREERLVLGVRRDRESEIEGVVHGLSGGGATVFLEPLETVAANNRLRKLHEEEREEVERILRSLADAVRERLSEIKATLDVVAELDFIFARADWADRFNAAAVELGAPTIEAFELRHPLLLLKRDVVPLEFKLSSQTRVLLISGPNAGGKTVVLKTLGILALLASCGLHVPASPDTRIPFFRNIFIDIGDEQSLDEDLSSFTAHLANLRMILEQADEDTLVLLDELGASTSPEEGGALGMAVLEALVFRGATVIVTTHLASLKYFAQNNPTMQNAGMEFRGHPTYRLIMGIPGASNALEIAEEVGFPTFLIEKARSFISPELLETSSLISRLSEERSRAESLRLDLERRLAETKTIEENYKKAEAELQERSRTFDKRMLAEQEKLISETRAEIENLVREIKESNASREAILKAKRFVGEREAELTTGKRTQNGRAKSHVFPVGTRVHSAQLNRDGAVVEINERSDEITVEMGTLRMTLPASDLSLITDEPRKTNLTATVHEEIEFNPRLHLRGLRAEEAYDKLMAHVAEALALGIEEVFIVHGKGTGVLRSLVMDFARRDRHVASFRVGDPFEGGDGVTVLRLAS